MECVGGIVVATAAIGPVPSISGLAVGREGTGPSSSRSATILLGFFKNFAFLHNNQVRFWIIGSLFPIYFLILFRISLKDVLFSFGDVMFFIKRDPR
jgi:hypothetical protein